MFLWNVQDVRASRTILFYDKNYGVKNIWDLGAECNKRSTDSLSETGIGKKGLVKKKDPL